ncbi:MAG: hypothetical protein BWY35_01563 [Firmicutes bacterium ADurb.Bin248]|nr:MAG: hypothetical protein BWY35_01563 [Firmicutes bacterium ADurb.Bin248]HOG00677.1 hypothetical protein [Clostridia bacterium]HPK15449.1 hypothetical protein [Clostridia bacterium]
MNQMEEKYRCLLECANPIIQNEAAAFLELQADGFRMKMLNHKDVQYWLNCLLQYAQKPQTHNSADTCLENSMHKLVSFGVRESDDPRIGEANRFILDFMYKNKGNPRFYDSVNPTITASWLACMGCEDDLVVEILRERVEAVYSFTKGGNYDIYLDPAGYPSIPKERAKHPFVNPALYEGNVWRLPSVHDVFAYANLPKILARDHSIRQMIDTAIAYIMDERYQRLPIGYGLMLVRPKSYYGMGWSMHLYRYFENSPLGLSGVVWNMELLSHFKRARETDWFKDTLRHLEGFEKDGLYEFPCEYVSERKNQYYVGGGHMGLGEDRRQKAGRKIESTAWMLRILRNCEPV